MPNRNQGFTLVELLITLSVLAVITAIAVPAMTNLINSIGQQTQVNQLLADLNFARSQAITSRRTVSLCAGETSCNGLARWKSQIIVFEDLDANGALDEHEQPLRISTITANHAWKWGNFRNRRYMSFKPNGTTHSLNGTFTLCRDNEALKAVVINITGRTRLRSPTKDDRCT